MDADEEAHFSSCTCGYRIYNAIWSVTIGEELQCAREVRNVKHRYTIYVLRSSDIASGALTCIQLHNSNLINLLVMCTVLHSAHQDYNQYLCMFT